MRNEPPDAKLPAVESLTDRSPPEGWRILDSKERSSQRLVSPDSPRRAAQIPLTSAFDLQKTNKRSRLSQQIPPQASTLRRDRNGFRRGFAGSARKCGGRDSPQPVPERSCAVPGFFPPTPPGTARKRGDSRSRQRRDRHRLSRAPKRDGSPTTTPPDERTIPPARLFAPDSSSRPTAADVRPRAAARRSILPRTTL